jgi:carboxyl-terminal processing protease
MVASLDDPYSVYYTKEEYKKYTDKMKGKYTGIGVVIKTDPADGLAYVIQVYDGAPAKEAGLKVGDKLVSADGEKLSGLDLEMVAEKIVGPEGTYVTLVIIQDGKQITKKIKRRAVEMNMVSQKMIDNEIGMITITQFNGDCVEGFTNAMDDLKKKNAKGVIIDLRNNPGGLLSDVCKILDTLLPAGTIVYTQNKEGKQDVYSSDANYWEIPMVVLVNGYSASASEVFAGAVQDYGRAKLVGVKTYGKGVVQTILPIEETGAGMKITTSNYYTPKGRNINGTGIIPDYIVKQEKEEQQTSQVDVQYQKAMEIIKGMMK